MIVRLADETQERKSGLVRQGKSYPKMGLETILLKEVTEVTSQRFFRRRSNVANDFGSFMQMKWDTLFWPKEVTMLLGPDDTLRLRERLPADVCVGGVYGMNVDSNNHVWFASNQSSLIHKFDERLDLIEQYTPRYEGLSHQLVYNYRDIGFRNGKVYILDAGLIGCIMMGFPHSVSLKPAIHIFSFPEFIYEHSSYFDLPMLYSAKKIGFAEKGILIGSKPNTNMVQKYRIDMMDFGECVKEIEIGNMIDSFFSEKMLHGFVEKEDTEREGGGVKKYMVLFDMEGTRQNAKGIDLPLQERIDQDLPIIKNRQDTFFCLSRGYGEKCQGLQYWGNVIDMGGNIHGRVAIEQGTKIYALCFDTEDRLVVLFEREMAQFGTRLFLGKYAVTY